MKSLFRLKRIISFAVSISLFSFVPLFSQATEIETTTDIVTEENNSTENPDTSEKSDATDNSETRSTTEIQENITEDSIESNNLENKTEEENPDTDTDTDTDIDTNTDPNSEQNEEKPEYKPLFLGYTDRPEVEKFRQQYLQPKWTQILENALEKGIDYRLYIRKSLEESELPPELEYLPVVESNYKTNAKSKSGALGLWQFMENSVRPFLTLNDYVDERLDPWKSTDAALKKLTDNYKMFNDWLLAIGAYNCGAGAMSRALAKAEEKNFWYLVEHNLIPNQTAQYVPKLIAIADLAINAEYYGIQIPSHQEEYESLYNEKNAIFDYVSVKKAYSLKQLSQEMRIDNSEISRLNPAFLMGFTHPSNQSFIRLPSGTEQSAREALAKMEPIEFPIKYKVVSGDSLWSISRRYGVSVSAICELNGIQENAILKIGKILYIPGK